MKRLRREVEEGEEDAEVREVGEVEEVVEVVGSPPKHGLLPPARPCPEQDVVVDVVMMCALCSSTINPAQPHRDEVEVGGVDKKVSSSAQVSRSQGAPEQLPKSCRQSCR